MKTKYRRPKTSVVHENDETYMKHLKYNQIKIIHSGNILLASAKSLIILTVFVTLIHVYRMTLLGRLLR